MLNSQHQIPSVFRRMMMNENDHESSNDDLDAMMNALRIQSEPYLYGLHGVHHGMRRHADDSWQRLPVRTLKENDIKILSKSEEKRACSICMADFIEGDVTRQLPCFHEFHRECVDKWFLQQNEKGNDASCPLDRKKIK